MGFSYFNFPLLPKQDVANLIHYILHLSSQWDGLTNKITIACPFSPVDHTLLQGFMDCGPRLLIIVYEYVFLSLQLLFNSIFRYRVSQISSIIKDSLVTHVRGSLGHTETSIRKSYKSHIHIYNIFIAHRIWGMLQSLYII